MQLLADEFLDPVALRRSREPNPAQQKHPLVRQHTHAVRKVAHKKSPMRNCENCSIELRERKLLLGSSYGPPHLVRVFLLITEKRK